METCIDRARPVFLYVWLPISITLRMVWFVYWAHNPQNFELSAVIMNSIRASLTTISFVIFTITWNKAIKIRLGVALLWMFRISAYVFVPTEQAGKVHNDPQHMTVLVLHLYISGLVIPSFTEYLISALSLPFIRPFKVLCLYASGNAPQSHLRNFQEYLFQNILLLSLGLYITWTIHSDRRRDWLLSSTITAPKTTGVDRTAKARRSPLPLRSDSRGRLCGTGHCYSWDELCDGYFSEAESNEHRQTIAQVPSGSPRAVCPLADARAVRSARRSRSAWAASRTRSRTGTDPRASLARGRRAWCIRSLARPPRTAAADSDSEELRELTSAERGRAEGKERNERASESTSERAKDSENSELVAHLS